MTLTITYHHTTEDGFKIYHLQDIDKAEYNDGRGIIYSTKEYCEELRDKMIKEAKEPTQLRMELDL
jgi:hypothetical protein